MDKTNRQIRYKTQETYGLVVKSVSRPRAKIRERKKDRARKKRRECRAISFILKSQHLLILGDELRIFFFR